MPTSLTTLPPEIFRCIVANIEPLATISPYSFHYIEANVESQATLLSLAQCSRQFYFCTIPRLYHHVIIQNKKGKHKQQTSQLRILASLLIQRPDLAGLVRCFTLHDEEPELQWSEELEEPEEPEEPEDSEYSQKYEDSEDSEDSEEPEEPGEDVIPSHVEVDQAFKIALNALSLSKEEENSWLRRLSHAHGCHPDLILALLLPALLKVERVFLVMNIGFDTHYLEQIIGRAARRERPFDIQPAFEALNVFFHTLGFFNVRSTGFIASLLKLPAIEVVSVGCGNNTGGYLSEDTNLKEMDTSSSSLIRLDLDTFGLSTADLRHMLRVPEALKTLFYTVCPGVPTNFTDIRHALGPQENSLWCLGFDLGFDEDYEFFLHLGPGYGCNIDNDFYGAMTSLIRFNSLKIFWTAALFLQTTVNGTEHNRLIDIFPPNLEQLYLTRCEVRCGFESLLDAIEHLLAQNSPQQLPFLKGLTLEGPKSKAEASLWRGTHETAIESLTRVAAARGVCVELYC